MVNAQILIKADSFEQLNECVEVIESTLKRSGCIKGEMAWEQEHGMSDCLPLGYQRKFDYLRTMPSESVAIFMPFNVREVQMPHATYYGMNVLSHNLILFDRVLGLINPSGFYLAASGGGKSFKVKTEITNIITGDENADVLVIDPEREYWKLAEAFGGEVVRFSNGSTNYTHKSIKNHFATFGKKDYNITHQLRRFWRWVDFSYMMRKCFLTVRRIMC